MTKAPVTSQLLRAALVVVAGLLASPASADAVRDLTPLNPGLSGDTPTDVSVDTGLTGDDTPPTGRDTPSPRGTHTSSNNDDVTQPPEFQTRHFGAQITLSCQAGDAPGSIIVVNQSDEPLPPGTRIKWQFRQTKAKGYFALLGNLRPGGTLVADDVMRNGQVAGGDCMARVL